MSSERAEVKEILESDPKRPYSRRLIVTISALVVESVDALDSKSSIRKGVGVRVSPEAPKSPNSDIGYLDIGYLDIGYLDIGYQISELKRGPRRPRANPTFRALGSSTPRSFLET